MKGQHNAAERLFEHADTLRGIPDDEAIAALAERNEARRQEAIAWLGRHWLGFPTPQGRQQARAA